MRCSIGPVPVLGRLALAAAILGASACDTSTTSPGAGTPSSLSVTNGVSQNAVVNATLPLPIAVQVTDASGTPVAGVVVSFAPASNQGSVSASQVTTDANGTAQVSWTLGTTAGADTLVASAGALSAVVIAYGAADVPANVAIVAGNNQSAAAGATLGTALAVKVTDRYGNPTPNATVQWSDNGGGAFSSATAATDGNGIAMTTYTLGTNPGVDDVFASLAAVATPVTVTFVENAM